MPTIIVSIVFFLGIAAVMGIGVMLGGSPLKGSCGGKGGPDCICDEYERQKCAARERMLQRLADKKQARNSAK